MPMFIARCCHRCSLLISLVDRKILEDKGPAVSGVRTGPAPWPWLSDLLGNIWDTRGGTQIQDLFVNFLYSSWNLALISSLKHTRHLRGRENKVPHLIVRFQSHSPKIDLSWGLCQLSPTLQESENKHKGSPRASRLAGFLTLTWPSFSLVVWGIPDNEKHLFIFFKGERIRFI